MGQYYTPLIISVDKQITTLRSFDFGSGMKLTEHSWIGNELVNAVYSLIFGKPKKVAWIGDYAMDDYYASKDAYTKAMPLEEFEHFYTAAWGEDAKRMPSKQFTRKGLNLLAHDTKGTYLINHSKKAFISLEEYIRGSTVKGGVFEGYCLNPLPLLTACGNGRGGGDYHREHTGYTDVGTWAFDLLEYSEMKPFDYYQAEYHFCED